MATIRPSLDCLFDGDPAGLQFRRDGYAPEPSLACGRESRLRGVALRHVLAISFLRVRGVAGILRELEQRGAA